MSDWHALILNTLLMVLTAAAAPLAVAIVGWVIGQLKKVNLSVSADQQAQLEYYTKQAILQAEEVITARIKAGTPSTAADKLAVAVGTLMQTTGVTQATAVDSIHAVLPVLGLGATANPQPAGQ